MSSSTTPLIVHVVYRFAVGGLENGLVNLINRLPTHAWRHAIIALTDVDPAFAARITRRGVDIVELHKKPGHAWPLYPALYRLFRAVRPAIVHTRNLAALEATVPAWAAGVPVRIHGEHGRDISDPSGARIRYQWVRRMYRPFVTRYVALAPDLAHYLHERVGVDPARIDQIYNGVDTARFLPRATRAPIAGCPFADPQQWLVGTVGRMDAVKDQANLARAFVQAVTANPDVRKRMRLVLVGSGAHRAEVESILVAGDARDLCWFAGERADVLPLLQGLDMFVLPSLAEGVSNTILEAMACGLPVIATRVGANANLVVENTTGVIVPAADSDALARAMLAYFEQPAQAIAHGRAGRALVEQRFSIDRMVDRYQQLYAAALAKQPFAVVAAARADRSPHA